MAAFTVTELKQKLKDAIERIVEDEDYSVHTADKAIRVLSALKDLKCTASTSINVDLMTPVPPLFQCPLSGHLMTDPVILTTGQVFFLFLYYFSYSRFTLSSSPRIKNLLYQERC